MLSILNVLVEVDDAHERGESTDSDVRMLLATLHYLLVNSQHCTHSTAQHSTTQHSTAQHYTDQEERVATSMRIVLDMSAIHRIC